MLHRKRMEGCRVELMHEVFALIYVGIDVHKKSCYACIKDEHGKKLKLFKFSNSSKGADKLLDEIDNRPAKAVLKVLVISGYGCI
jgi:transposase